MDCIYLFCPSAYPFFTYPLFAPYSLILSFHLHFLLFLSPTSFPAPITFFSICYSSFGTNTLSLSTKSSSWLLFKVGPGRGLRMSNRRDVYLTDKPKVFLLTLITNALKFDSNSAISTLLLFTLWYRQLHITVLD